ncbi:hypothetical protein DPMN_036204 [Dreissena polymorpha]|uniref:Uncharacterized protein n=1 Tax=Dreissena polymorpha TaxID=45954 RepID=A0A9D4MB35_DREPO|nr:hypothetical protein DPMN_036204 [Dreissena polymorpha]
MSVYGNESISSLYEYYKDLLTTEDQAKIPEEWQQFKVRMSAMKGMPSQAALSQILKLDEKLFVHMSSLWSWFLQFHLQLQPVRGRFPP